MLHAEVEVSSATFSPWVPLNDHQTPFNVSLAVDLDSAASAITYTVEHTFDDFWRKYYPISGSHSGTTATLTFLTNHNLNVGDWIQVVGGGTLYDGTYAVATAPSATTLTYTTAGSGTTAATSGFYCNMARVWGHEFLAAKTTADDGNYAYPVKATRLNVTAHSAGKATLQVLQGV